MIYDNTKIKKLIRQKLELEIAKLDKIPSLEIVMIGNNLPSQKYVGIKQKIGKELGIEVNCHTNENQIGEILQNIGTNGLIFQLPLPSHLEILPLQILPKNDVDLLGKYSDLLWQQDILPPTAKAIDMVLKDMLNLNIWQKADFGGKNVAIIGQGQMVGGPLLKIIKDQGATIFSLNKNTKNLPNLLSLADVVISAAGVPDLVDSNWLKTNCLVIDAATCESNNQLVGDVKTSNLRQDILLCTSPKGVGALTVLNLFLNLVALQNASFSKI